MALLIAASDRNAPGAPTVTMVSSGASPALDIGFAIPPLAGDLIHVWDNGDPVVGANPYTITTTDIANSQLNLSLPNLSVGAHVILVRHQQNGHGSAPGSVSITV